MSKVMKRLVASPSVIYTLLSGMGSGINFVTLIIFGRLFSVEDYGQITTFQALIANIAVFMIPLQLMICKRIAAMNDKKYLEELIKIAFFINIGTLIVMFCGTVPIMRYLHFANTYIYGLFVSLVLANNLYMLLIGAAQGKMQFIFLGLVNILFYGIKLVFSVILKFVNLDIVSVLIGFLIAVVICICIMCYKMQLSVRFDFKRKYKISKDFLIEYLLTLLLYAIVSMYMNNGDLLIGNLFIDQNELGLYSVSINLSKISVFLIATPIATIVLPKVATNRNNIQKQRNILVVAEFTTIMISLLYGVFFYLFGGWIIKFLYGNTYAEGTKYLLPCMFFSVVLGLFWVFYQYCIATDLMRVFTLITASIGFFVFMVLIIIRPEMDIIPIVMSIGMLLSVCATIEYKKLVRMR